jgi:glycosyltransferase involved in cell wall biosynthesis
MKILHFLHYPDNGIVTVVFDQIRYSQATGIEYHVALLQRSPKVDQMAAEYGIRVHYLEREGLPSLRSYRQLLKTLVPDLVHTHSYRPRIMTALAKRLGWWKGAAVTTVHTEYPYLTKPDLRNRFKRATEAAAMRTLQCPIVVNNRRVEEVMSKTGTGRAFGVRKIYNGVAFPRLDRAGGTQRPPIAIKVARFTPEKNHSLLLDAWVDVVKRVPGAKLWLLGDGELQQAMEEKAKALKIADSVVFWGWVRRSDVPSYLTQAQVFVLSSLHEGLPTVAIEASFAELPVVSTSVAGIDEIIEPERTGLIVSGQGALADALVDLLSDPARCETMGRLGRERVESLFGVHRFVDEQEAVYRAMTSASASSG